MVILHQGLRSNTIREAPGNDNGFPTCPPHRPRCCSFSSCSQQAAADWPPTSPTTWQSFPQRRKAADRHLGRRMLLRGRVWTEQHLRRRDCGRPLVRGTLPHLEWLQLQLRRGSSRSFLHLSNRRDETLVPGALDAIVLQGESNPSIGLRPSNRVGGPRRHPMTCVGPLEECHLGLPNAQARSGLRQGDD